MEEIKDVFCESDDFITENFLFAEGGGYNLNGRPLMEVSETSRITTLSELFTEYYLFDSSSAKNIQQFLNDEELTDIFTESQFMDLICGKAYLDTELIHLIKMQLPFYISLNKLEKINLKHTEDAYLIQHTEKAIQRTQEILTRYYAARKKQINEQRKTHRATHLEQTKEREARYRDTHREQIKQYRKQYRDTHREQINEYDRMYRAAHLEHEKKRKAQYRDTHKEQIKQSDKRYYKENKEKILNKSKEYYNKNKEKHLVRSKKYRSEHKEQIKQSDKRYYEENKEKIKENQTKYHQEIKQKKEAAKNVCAAYLFLLKLRKTNKEQYLTMYSAQAKPITWMLRTCPALQNMNINMCPLCNENCENELEKCCNQKVLALPNIMQELRNIANELKQK